MDSLSSLESQIKQVKEEIKTFDGILLGLTDGFDINAFLDEEGNQRWEELNQFLEKFDKTFERRIGDPYLASRGTLIEQYLEKKRQ